MLCIDVCVCVCVYVKTRIFFVRNNREKERGHLVLTYMYMWAGMSKSLNLLFIQAHCWRVSVFECVWLFLPWRVVSVHRWPPVCRFFFWTKKFWFLILFEWMEIIYFMFTRVGFISGQLRFKRTDVCVNTTSDLI